MSHPAYRPSSGNRRYGGGRKSICQISPLSILKQNKVPLFNATTVLNIHAAFY
jgi:hypothetical protein